MSINFTHFQMASCVSNRRQRGDQPKLDMFLAYLPGKSRVFLLYFCILGDTSLIMGDFNAATDTDRAGYEDCVGPHGSGNHGESGSMFLGFAKGEVLHRWTWYSNTGNAVNIRVFLMSFHTVCVRNLQTWMQL